MGRYRIGYQILKRNPKTYRYDDIPDDLYSFVIFKKYYNAYNYMKSIKDKCCYKIVDIYKNDIEEPAFYEDISHLNEDDVIENIKNYLQSKQQVKVKYVNIRQGSIYFDGIVHSKFLDELKKELGAKSVCVTYEPCAISKGVVIVFDL